MHVLWVFLVHTFAWLLGFLKIIAIKENPEKREKTKGLDIITIAISFNVLLKYLYKVSSSLIPIFHCENWSQWVGIFHLHNLTYPVFPIV